MPWFYLTDEVVEASTLCLVAQAEQMVLQFKNKAKPSLLKLNLLKYPYKLIYGLK